MPDVGQVVTSFWIWRPNQVVVDQKYQVLVTNFEYQGAEQRRLKSASALHTVRMTFSQGNLTTQEMTDIWRFYRQHQGTFCPFWLPTYARIATIRTDYVGSFRVDFDQTLDFTWDPASHYNRFYVEKWNGDYDFFTITSVSVGNRYVMVSSPGVNSFQIGNPVYPVIYGRFTQGIPMSYLPAYLTEVGLEITEVHS